MALLLAGSAVLSKERIVRSPADLPLKRFRHRIICK
jgi:hypothetical protein